MNVDIINAFIDATEQVLTEMIPGVEYERGVLFLKSEKKSQKEIITLIGLSGEVKGRVVLEFDFDTALKLSGAMIGENISEFNDMCQSAITELTNIISGNAINIMNSQGITVDISVPIMVIGEKFQIVDGGSTDSEIMIIPLNTNFGDIEINVFVKPK